jgi:PAS domain S-box-containing protein
MPDSGQIDVLVIEDDADARTNLRDILELDDYHVTETASAAAALALADWSKFSAIILDRKLPDATADQLLPRLKALAPAAAVIVVTGYADIQGAIAALRQGAADYILKPFNPEALRTSLGRIAERRRLALAKERSEANFRHLVEAAECMIVILRPDDSILYFSPFAERLTGYAASEVLGRPYTDLFLAEADRRSVAEMFGEALAGHPVLGHENPIRCRDGSQRWMTWNARALVDYEGGPAILKVGQDITHLKQAQQRALQAERLAAIGQMMTGLAHESRNALQRGQACLEMLALEVHDRPRASQLITRIQQAQDHLHHLFEDVRGYAAPIQLERQLCDVRAIWREAWALLEPVRAGMAAVLREETDGVDLRCQADSFRLGQVFHNILDNALATGRADVEVRIRAEAAALDGRPALRIGIRDNGLGLDAQQRSKVFEPFFTTKTKGTGLGLAIVKRIIEAHGGRIALSEEVVPGAEFVITLPKEAP